MSLLKIIKYGDPLLRQKCQEVGEMNLEVEMLARAMLEIMRQEKGIGLAAPQVGDKRRIIIADIGQRSFSLINPRIIGKSKESQYDYEGCLSLPKVVLKIKRAREIEIEGYLLEQKQRVKIKADGLLARVFQHEIDHLDGVLITDRVSYFKKLKAVRKLKRVLRV